MWIFTDSGFLSLVQHPNDPEMLFVQTQNREEMDRVVLALDDIAGEKHEVVPAEEQGCRFAIVARREDVGALLLGMVGKINYSAFTQSVSFDFGTDPNFLLWVAGNGLQVARIKPEVR